MFGAREGGGTLADAHDPAAPAHRSAAARRGGRRLPRARQDLTPGLRTWAVRSVGGSHPDRARHAGATEAAVAVRDLGQVLLVVVLGVIERRGVVDLRGDVAVARVA